MESFYHLIPSFFVNTSSVPLLFCYGLLLNIIPLTAVWIVSVAVKNASVIDCYWSLAFVLLNAIYIHFSGHPTSSNTSFTLLQEWNIPWDRRVLVTLLLQGWAVKLSLYLIWRKIGEPEDFRYREFRRIVTEKGKAFWWVSYFRVYLVQGVLISIISLPLIFIHVYATEWSPIQRVLDMAGITLWIIGFVFETVGDLHLAAFKSNPSNKGKLLTTGLWQHSRHPNYFGDALIWWAFYVLACSCHPIALLSFPGPFLMNYLLLKISGVPFMEKMLRKTRSDYEHYMKHTNMFIPWLTRPQEGQQANFGWWLFSLQSTNNKKS